MVWDQDRQKQVLCADSGLTCAQFGDTSRISLCFVDEEPISSPSRVPNLVPEVGALDPDLKVGSLALTQGYLPGFDPP